VPFKDLDASKLGQEEGRRILNYLVDKLEREGVKEVLGLSRSRCGAS